MRNIGLKYTQIGCEVSLNLYDYALIYLHPWEFTKVPEVRGVPKHITHNVWEKILENVERLIISLRDKGYKFGTIPDIIH